jgi:hypothetical protein
VNTHFAARCRRAPGKFREAAAESREPPRDAANLAAVTAQLRAATL